MAPKRREGQGQLQSLQLRTAPRCWTRRVGTKSFRSSQAAERAFSSKTSKADHVSCAPLGKTSPALAADACDALGRMRNGRATEEDSVPTEYPRAVGPGYFRAFSRLARRSLQVHRADGTVPVPKERVPLSTKNARGLLLACHSGKIYSRIARTNIQHLLPEAAQGQQSGGVKGGSTAAPQIVLSLSIKKMRKKQKCAAVLFTDIEAELYSDFAEVALGSLLLERGSGFSSKRT